MSDAAQTANVQLVDGAQRADAVREAVVKAHIVGSDQVQSSNAIQAIEAGERAFANAGALAPPYDPASLCRLSENSSALRPNIDAYAANIDSHGHRLEPTIDFEAENVAEVVAEAIHAERLWMEEHRELPDGLSVEPTDEEVEAAVQKFQKEARIEKLRLDIWTEQCCVDSSLTDVRRQTRTDIETTGNGYWEILRDGTGDIAAIEYVPGCTMRLMPLDEQMVMVETPVKVSPIRFSTVRRARRFRRFVQVVDNTPPVFFKSLGDPRVISRKSGRVFESTEALKQNDESDAPATEMMHFKVHAPDSAYGVPRWIGGLLEVLGSRQAGEVNYFQFVNNNIPPLAILVSGGRLAQSAVPKIEDFLENHFRGSKNRNKILIIEAESSRSGNGQHTGSLKVEFRPLTEAQANDALFQKYDERNIDKVGALFRLPRLLRGDIRDFNRSTALAAILLAEEQVFEPERQSFDGQMNRKILWGKGIRFWKFCSNAPVTRDPQVMAQIVRELVNANVLTPEEGRQLARDVFNHDFKQIRAAWVKQPVQLTLAGFPVEGLPDSKKPREASSEDVENLKAAFLRLRDETTEEEVVHLPDDVLSSWIEQTSRDGELADG